MRNLILSATALVLSVISQAQSIGQKLLTHEVLDSTEVADMAAFDTVAYRLDLGTASIDTTVVFSDTVLYSIIMLGDITGVNALFYLMSFDRGLDRPIDLVYLHDAPDIEQSLSRYRWVEHGIWRTGEVGTIEYDCHVTRPGTLHERTSMQATGRRFWKVAPDGRISGGGWIAEEK